MKDYEKIKVLVDYFLEAYHKEDPEYQAAKPFLSQIKEYFATCYSYSGFCDWLAAHKNDILINFTNAEIVSKEDFKNYNDWEEAKWAALFISDDGNSVVLRW